MSLEDNSEFILNTEVTWSDFESDLRAALGTEARFGQNKSVIDIGDGNGFASCCGLITCDWLGAAADEKLPRAVVLKIPSILPLRKMNDLLPADQKMFNFDEAAWAKMEAQINGIHNNEVAMYDFIEEFEEILMPKKYFGKAVSNEDNVSGTICLEYMENSETMHFYQRHTVEQVRQIAKALGKVQACSLKQEPTAPSFQNDFFKKMEEFWPLETFRGMFKGILAVDTSEKTKELMEKIDNLIPTYHCSNLATSIHKQMDFRPVLVNGDMHTGNVLIDKDSGDLLALIDWQVTHLGVGVEDLHRIAMSSLTAETRRASMPTIIEEMYNSMVQNLDGAEAPYSLDTKTEKDVSLTVEEKAARKEVMLDKVIGTLEDVVAIDSKNNNNIGNLKLRY